MGDAPERIWVDAEMQPWRVWTIEMSDLPCYIRADLHQAALDRAEADKAAAVEALIWCSAANDFQEEGKAREGWLKLCAPIIRALPVPAPMTATQAARVPEVAALVEARDKYHGIANLVSEFAAELVERLLEMDMDEEDDMRAKCEAYAKGGYRALEGKQ